MKVEAFSPSEYGKPGGWWLSDWAAVDDILKFRDRQCQAQPGRRVLCVLDDQAQAHYTSGHAIGKHNLDLPYEAQLTAEELERFESDAILTPERWANTVTTRLMKLASEASLDATAGRLIPINSADVGLLDIYRHPDRAFTTPLKCYAIHADNPSLSIAALPNGYFTDDLTPVENYLLAEQMRTRFGYEILGLGSFLAAFVRPEPLSEAGVSKVISSVRDMYMGMTDELAAEWAATAANRRWFLLSYRGS